ncbi:MAG: hypothetical protein ACYC64_07085 [Armatimonadota bacterium]
MKHKLVHMSVACLVMALVILIAASTAAFSQSWNSFSEASFTGITVSPAFATNVLTYNVSLGAAPTITISGNTYNVVWVQGFYALSADGVQEFYAGGSNITSGGNTWKWVANPNIGSPNNYVVAGWEAQGNPARITPGNNKSFSYTHFQIPQNVSVILGLHVGYWNAGTQENVTARYKPGNPEVPEASALLLGGIGAPFLGMAAMARRRFGRTR